MQTELERLRMESADDVPATRASDDTRAAWARRLAVLFGVFPYHFLVEWMAPSVELLTTNLATGYETARTATQTVSQLLP